MNRSELHVADCIFHKWLQQVHTVIQNLITPDQWGSQLLLPWILGRTL